MKKTMKTLVTAIQKGGQGKTFATCHLAFDFAERGLKVLVIDLDTQGNASFTLDAHTIHTVDASSLFTESPEDVKRDVQAALEASQHNLTVIPAVARLADMEKVPLNQAAPAFKKAIDALAPLFDVCLIDTAPSLGVAMTSAIISAGYMVSPVEMEAYSLQGMKKMVSVISNLRQVNKNLVFIGMIPNKIDGNKPRHKQNLEALKAAYPKLVAPCHIGSRDSIAQALGEQIPVWKIRKTAARAAAREVREMAQYIHKKMEL